MYTLPFEIEIHANININSAAKYFSENLKKLSLTDNQINDYRKLKKPIFEIILVSANSMITGGFEYKKKKEYQFPIAIPDYNLQEYGFHSIFLRNSKSYTLLSQFLTNSFNKVFNFKIKTNNNLDLKIDELNKLNFGNGQFDNANGILPFTSDNIKNPLPDVFPLYNYSNPNQKCGFGYQHLPVNKEVAKYLCEREKSELRETPYLLILHHQYKKDGLVYKLDGNFNISLSDLGKMSTITIDY
jgi:hypothetical protein